MGIRTCYEFNHATRCKFPNCNVTHTHWHNGTEEEWYRNAPKKPSFDKMSGVSPVVTKLFKRLISWITK
jgi:hypothetical protein